MIPEVLRHVITFALERLLDRRLEANALTAETQVDDQELWRLGYSASYRVLWSAGTLVWAAAVALMLFARAQGQLDWRLVPAVVLFGAFLVFALVMVWDAFTQQITVSHWGITERRRGAVAAACAWSDVARVRFVWYLDSYQVIPRQGRPIRFSMNILGLLRFKSLAVQHTPAEALEGIAARLSDPSRR